MMDDDEAAATPPRTGDATVDAALDAVAEAATMDAAERSVRFEAAHQALRDFLDQRETGNIG